MDQKVLNMLATTAAEFHVLGDDKNSEKVMSAVEWLIVTHGLPDDAFDRANGVFLSLRDLSITDIPDVGWPEEAENCIDAMNECIEELLAGTKLQMECAELLRDYWAERNANRD